MKRTMKHAGVLCVHGFTGTPFEMQFLAEALHRHGFVATVPTLPGHATTPEDLNRTTRDQWSAAVRDALIELRERCEWVAIAGQSIGGLLALQAAADDIEVDAVACLAVPLWLGGPSQMLVRGLARLPRGIVRRLGHRAKHGGSDVRDERVKAENPAYDVLPLAAVVELSELMTEVRRRLEDVRAPLLVIHGRQDHTAPVACADELLFGVSSAVREMLIVPESYHLVACDVEHELVAARVADFFKRAVAG